MYTKIGKFYPNIHFRMLKSDFINDYHLDLLINIIKVGFERNNKPIKDKHHTLVTTRKTGK